MHKFGPFLILLVTLALAIVPTPAKAQNDSEHELTLYVMPTLYPLNWDSPASLYTSVKSSLVKTITKSNHYLIGHVAIKLKSSLLAQPILTGQASGPLSEKLNLLFKQKVGFAIVGLPISGRLETAQELEKKLEAYRKRKKLAFIRYQINEEAAQRIISFLKEYSTKNDKGQAASDFYGGVFWPRYHNEGSGCSAFAAVLLDINNLLVENTDKWKLDIKVPIQLIGGEVNNGKKVRIKEIEQAKSWYTQSGKANIDYVDYEVYEPNLMFDWILNKREANDPLYVPIDENSSPGLMINATGVEVDKNEQLFQTRTKPNLFVDYHLQKTAATPNN